MLYSEVWKYFVLPSNFSFLNVKSFSIKFFFSADNILAIGKYSEPDKKQCHKLEFFIHSNAFIFSIRATVNQQYLYIKLNNKYRYFYIFKAIKFGNKLSNVAIFYCYFYIKLFFVFIVVFPCFSGIYPCFYCGFLLFCKVSPSFFC